MADVRVTCITRAIHKGHECISHIGSLDGRWIMDQEQAIASIDAKSNTFFVLDGNTGKRADVGVIRPTSGYPYLRTYADGVWTDNLLSLGSCP